MTSINEITIDHISKLSPEQLSNLLHQLLRIEADKNSLEDYEILVPQKINVADGGEDGRIVWSGNPSSTQWLKNKLTIFQSKATDLSPSKCYEEILEPEIKNQLSKLKSQVNEVIENKGGYVLFTSKDLNPKQKNARIKKFREAIQDAGHPNYATFEIRIYDANSIKDWVNQNIATVTFVQACAGITRPTKFRTWHEWKEDMPGTDITYQTNNTLINNIEQIRSELKIGKVIRVIGHSGLGKTRMVLETFRDDLSCPEIKMLQSQLVYYDMGIGSLDDISGYILSHKDHQSGIIIVDNCDENSHNTITGLIKSSDNFKIITIDFSSQTDERAVIKLERNDQKDIVQNIIEEEFQSTLTQTDKEYIAVQSEGYPQMAILFSESVKTKGLQGLNNELPDVFLKKLVFGRGKQSDFEYEIIKACSVVSHFGFIDNNIASALREEEKENLNKQTEYVRKRICGTYQGREIDSREFYKTCLKYKKNNIIEQRGSRLMVRPSPLAINLAAQWWRETPHDTIKEILTELKDSELGRCLVERLVELDQLDAAKEIVNELWGPNSPFGTAEVLNTSLGSLLFRYVVEVNPEATAQTLQIAFGNMTKEQILKIKEGRRNLVWALEKLCFRKETFSSAAKILFSFAVSENETWGNNSTNQFIQLFQLLLSGTEASLMERFEVIRWGLNKNDNDYNRIAINALASGLSNDHFTRSGGADKQGSGTKLVDYRPDWEEVRQYWSEIINTLTEFACLEGHTADLAKEKISGSIRVLVRNGQFTLIENSIRKIISVKGSVWLEALNNLKRVLGYLKTKEFSDDTIKQVENLINLLTPSDIKSQLLLNVSKPEWHISEKEDEDHYIDRSKLNAEAFAEYLIKNNVQWIDYVNNLLEGEQRQGYNFGVKYGELVKNKNEIIEVAIQTLKTIPKESQNPEFLGGLLYGAGDRTLFEQTIDRIIEDEALRQHSFYLTRVINPIFSDVMKLFKLVQKYDLPIQEFVNFQYGRALDALSVIEVLELCEKMCEYENPGRWTALSVLFMFCYGHDENWVKSKNFFKKLIGSTNMIIENQSAIRMDGYYWSKTIIKILSQEKENEFAAIISKQIIEFCNQPRFNYSFESYIKEVIEILFDKYFEAVWDNFGSGIIGGYGTFFHLENLIGTRNGYLGGTGIIFRNPSYYEFIINWCLMHPKIAPKRIARMMPIEVTESGKTKWHPFSYAMIDKFGNDEEFLEQLSSNMGTFGTVGSRIPYYTRQKNLLEELIGHQFPKVRKWAKEMLDYTEKQIKRERIDDDERYL